MLTDRLHFSRPNPFDSFWMAGYECTDKLNCFGNRVDFLQVTGHLKMIDEDYQSLSFFDIKTVREGIRWNHVEKIPHHYNWAEVRGMIISGRENGIQQVWDLCHFGFPDDLTPLHPMFARRFAAMSRSFVRFYRSVDPDGALIVTPFNEVGFLSWLGGDVCGTAPYCRGYGWEVKYALMRAYIEGIEAMKAEDPTVRIMATEPLVNMVPPLNGTAEDIAEAARQHEHQFQALDILSGRACPELRGRPEYIDIVGCNFYYNNQWVIGNLEFLPWRNQDADPRWVPLSNLLLQLHQRYNCPVVLSETSHPGIDRPLWVQFIAEQCCQALKLGVPLWGVCWYPIIDRPDWDHLQPWHRSGLWDIEVREDGSLERILHEPSAKAMLHAQTRVNNLIRPSIVGTV